MYISSTNLYLDLPDVNVSPKWITSEKYYNCDYFYNKIFMKQKKRRLLWKKDDNK